MKKYFARFIPGKGAIYVSDDYWGGIYKKYTLSLCTKAINIGDKVRESINGEEFEWTRMMDNCLERGDTFKIVGIISSGATWVKENDEFDEDEILIHSLAPGSPAHPLVLVLIKAADGYFH